MTSPSDRTTQVNRLGVTVRSASDHDHHDHHDRIQVVRLPVPPRRFIHPHTVLYEPNPIDQWLTANKSDGWHSDICLPSLVDASKFDQVLSAVILEVTNVRLHTSIFSDVHSLSSVQTPCYGLLRFDKPDTYTLYLRVVVPVSLGLPINALISPRVILGQYEGFCFDDEAPLWTGMRPGLPLEFLQPRGAMAELFHGLAIWAENLAVVSGIQLPFPVLVA
jgi:hypothetical protein